MSETKKLLKAIDEFCSEHDLAPSTFGKLAVNDGKFYVRVKAGGEVFTSTVSRCFRFMATYAPARRGRPPKSVSHIAA